MTDDRTLVIFRRWRDSGSLVALFPEIPSDIHGWYCEAYEHVGQHGGASYHEVIAATNSATQEEAAPLARELERIDYRLRPGKRASRRLHERRRVAARAVTGR